MSACLSVLSVCLSVCLCVLLIVCVSFCLSACLSVLLFVCTAFRCLRVFLFCLRDAPLIRVSDPLAFRALGYVGLMTMALAILRINTSIQARYFIEDSRRLGVQPKRSRSAHIPDLHACCKCAANSAKSTIAGQPDKDKTCGIQPHSLSHSSTVMSHQVLLAASGSGERSR